MSEKVEKISESESEIMKVLWEAGQALPYAAIRTGLTARGCEWGSPTVNTLVNRLVKKGVLIQQKREVFYYTPTVTEAEYTEAKTRSFLQKIYDGNARNLLSALVNYQEVTQEDLDNLRSYLRQGGEKDA